jgi:hypothetical protein
LIPIAAPYRTAVAIQRRGGQFPETNSLALLSAALAVAVYSEMEKAVPAPGKRGFGSLFCVLALCLSRACLGTKIAFMHKWLKLPFFAGKKGLKGHIGGLLMKCVVTWLSECGAQVLTCP